MKRVAAALCVMAIGCAAGAEMRPRGKRNSIRIEALENRIVSLEEQITKLSDEIRALRNRNDTSENPPLPPH